MMSLRHTQSVPGHHALKYRSCLPALLVFALFETTPVFSDSNAQQPVDTTTNAASRTQDQPTQDDSEFEDIELLDLDIPIVVTASRREQRITTVPYAMTVVTARDIRLAGCRSIGDALRLAPGVDIAELSSQATAVSPRGFHGLIARQTLVLVDGRQIFDSLFGGTLLDAWPLQLEDIERIEVIRGPGGVTWGANAVNGVINIITKDPADQIGTTITAGGGNRGWHKSHLGHAFADDELRLRVSVEYEASDGFKRGASIFGPPDDDFKTGKFGLYAIRKINKQDLLTFSAGIQLTDGGTPSTPLAGFNQRRNAGTQSSFLLAKWLRETSPEDSVEIVAYANDAHVSPGIRTTEYRYQQIALQLRRTVRHNDSHVLTWGIDGRTDLLDGTNAEPTMLTDGFVSTAIFGFYLEDEWKFAPKWTAYLGARLDYEFYEGFQPSARAALSYEVSGNSVVYGAVSRAFQAPPVGSRFVDAPFANGLVRATGESDLRSETLLAYELGYRGRFFKHLDLNLNLFWHEYADMTTLSPELGPPGLIHQSLDNRADVSLYGLEADVQYKLTDNVRLLGNYTLQLHDWRADVAITDKDAMVPPKHKFMVGVRYSPTEDLHLSSHLYYVDPTKSPNPSNPLLPRHIDQYWRLDFCAIQEFANDNMALTIGVKNLLDSNHYEGTTTFLHEAEVPRMIFAELRFSIE